MDECLTAKDAKNAERQLHLPVVYQDLKIASGLRIDQVRDENVVVEVEAVEQHCQRMVFQYPEATQ